MKKANTILSHILHLPEFKSLQSHYCYQKFISLLSPKFQKAIAFVYIRQNTLFVALRHPGYKMELNYNKDLLKSILSLLRKQDERCNFLVANKVVFFNSKFKTIIQDEKKEQTIPYYSEMASGDFEIECKDEDLQEAFKKIKSMIKKN
ncbi:MAG: hypothetical protein GXO60_04580 [Epsilonproteobacteria bacterium]|nr:hypothetical protein [Campylobacterota bacterium]